MNHISNQIDQLADMFAAIDIKDLANYKVMCEFRQALVNEGLPNSLAEQVVAEMAISVSNTVMDQAALSLQQLIVNMSKCVALMYAQIKKDFQTDPDVILLSMTRGMNLKLEF
jgi:hypothetical protein